MGIKSTLEKIGIGGETGLNPIGLALGIGSSLLGGGDSGPRSFEGNDNADPIAQAQYIIAAMQRLGQGLTDTPLPRLRGAYSGPGSYTATPLVGPGGDQFAGGGGVDPAFYDLSQVFKYNPFQNAAQGEFAKAGEQAQKMSQPGGNMVTRAKHDLYNNNPGLQSRLGAGTPVRRRKV